MLAQGSSWDACLVIITTNSFDRKGKQEREAHLYVPGAPKTLRGYQILCFSIMAPMYILSKLIQGLLSATHAEQNLESWLIARFADNCFINSSWLPLFLARHMGPGLRRAWQQFLNEGEMEQPASLPPPIPRVSAGFSFFSHTQCVKGIPCLQASGNLQRTIILKAGGAAQQGTRFTQSLHIPVDRMANTFVLNKYHSFYSPVKYSLQRKCTL